LPELIARGYVKILKPSSITLFAMVLVVAVCRPCRGEPLTRESQVKAAFIYNFTQFIDWPADTFNSSEAPFVVGVVGDSPLTGALMKIMIGKFVGAHPIVVTHFAAADGVRACQILFVPESLDAEMPPILARIGKSPCLIVGEGDGVLPGGGAARLFLEDSKMRFQLNAEVIDSVRLKASAKLMKLARIYKK
jgi:hypothetical protein